RSRNMTLGKFFADVSRTRMQHQPDVVLSIKANLDKVVSSAESSELDHRFSLAVLNFRMQIVERFPTVPTRGLIDRFLVGVKSNRDRTLDLVAKLCHLTVENSARERRLDGHHSAADVDADRCGNNGVLGCDDRSDHRTFSEMRVWHQSDVLVNTRQSRNVAEHVLFVERQPVRNPRENVRLSSADIKFVIRHSSS